MPGYIFELSGEHVSLPKAEVLACLEAQDIEFHTLEEDEGVLTVDAPEMNIAELERRLALAHFIDEKLISCEVDELSSRSETFEIGNGSFAVRARRIQNYHEQVNLKKLEKGIADSVEGKNEVDLTNPDIEIRIIVSNRCHIGRRLAKIDRSSFEARKVQFRPYFSPVSLHPRLARALVNLSRVKKGQTLLDPFCGTGGVLIEASLIGARPIGSDIDDKMVKGCQENLSCLGLDDAKLLCKDIGEIADEVGKVDAIATDPPYGKSATTNREGINSLYTRSFETLTEVLEPGGYLSIAIPEKELIQTGKKFLSLVESHALRVHRSLTRNFCVYRKG